MLGTKYVIVTTKRAEPTAKGGRHGSWLRIVTASGKRGFDTVIIHTPFAARANGVSIDGEAGGQAFSVSGNSSGSYQRKPFSSLSRSSAMTCAPSSKMMAMSSIPSSTTMAVVSDP